MIGFFDGTTYATTYQVRDDHYRVIVADTFKILIDDLELYTEAEQLAEQINLLPDEAAVYEFIEAHNKFKSHQAIGRDYVNGKSEAFRAKHGREPARSTMKKWREEAWQIILGASNGQ